MTATFNEAVQSSTITFTLTPSGGSAITASLSYNSSTDTVTLTPSSALAYNTKYTAALSGAEDSAGDPMTSPFSWSFTTEAASTSPPSVSSESPASNATNVPVSTTVTATFNEAVQSSTITFTLTPSGGSAITASLSYNSSTDTVTLTPSSTLAYNTNYTATVSGAENSSGIAMTSPFSWSFTTDVAPPSVTKESPASNATNVPVSTTATATFNEAVQSSTIIFTLTPSGGSAITASLSYNSSTDTVTLTPKSALAYNTKYTAAVSGAKDSAGDPMTSPFSWSFTTDVAPPSVTKESPASNATNVPVSTTATATFNEAVQSSTIIFTLTPSGGSAITASLSYNSSTDTVTLTPKSALAYNTKYTAAVSGAKDSAGDPMTSPFSWSFTTDVAPPSVTKESPASNATNVPVSTTATATFNEAVQSSTIIFTLTPSGGSAITASLSYNSSTDTVTLTPRSALAYNTKYTAAVSGAKDSAGDPMTSPFSWSFTTDVAPPSVTKESPASNATNVPVSTTATATFNEAVQSSTIIFTLTPSGGSAITASLSYNSSTDTVTLTPKSALAYNTKYTAAVSGAKDSAGDPMTSPFSWSFTTDVAPPSVTKESPASNATNVPVSTTATATFNEAVQSSTIIFTLTPSGGSAITASLSYNSSTDTVTLTPKSALAYNTKYTAAVSGAKDSAGDPMTSPFSWSFTTEVAPSGTTFYVATTGSDSNSGSKSSPFATLQHAMMSLLPGDTLDVESGSYTGFISGWDSTPASSGDPYGYIDGTAGAPITIQADPSASPGSVIINSRDNKTAVGIDLEPGDNYITISGLTIENSNGSITKSGIKVTGNNDSLINDTVSGVGGFGIIADNANNVLIQGNTVSNTTGSGSSGHGIYISGSTNGAVVKGNTVYNNGYIGIHIDGDASEGGLGLVTDALIADNVIYGNGQNGINADGLQNSIIENNLIYNYQGYGICLYQVDASAGSSNNLIVNNTIDAGTRGSGAALRILDASTGNTILNNILLGGRGITLRISSDSMSGLVSNDNVTGSLFQSEDTGGTESLAQWQSATGQDKNSLTATESQLFVNPSGYNYQELSTSPSIGAGTATDSPSTDMLGNPRPGSYGYDIGTYEYEGATSKAPMIVSESSGQTATNVPVSTTATATFNEAVQSSTITFTLTPSGGSAITASLSYNSSTDTVTLTPRSALAYNTKYTATVSGAEDSAGDSMRAPFSWSFTTKATTKSRVTDRSTLTSLDSLSQLDSAQIISQSSSQTVQSSSISAITNESSSELGRTGSGSATPPTRALQSSFQSDLQMAAVADLVSYNPLGIVPETLLTSLARDRLQGTQKKPSVVGQYPG